MQDTSNFQTGRSLNHRLFVATDLLDTGRVTDFFRKLSRNQPDLYSPTITPTDLWQQRVLFAAI